jgi:hypothetical protein
MSEEKKLSKREQIDVRLEEEAKSKKGKQEYREGYAAAMAGESVDIKKSSSWLNGWTDGLPYWTKRK